MEQDSEALRITQEKICEAVRILENRVPKKKNPAAVALGRKGGKARVKNTTKKQRSEQMSAVAKARWKKNGTIKCCPKCGCTIEVDESGHTLRSEFSICDCDCHPEGSVLSPTSGFGLKVMTALRKWYRSEELTSEDREAALEYHARGGAVPLGALPKAGKGGG